MAVSVTGVMRAINKLSKPLQEKVLKKLGLSTEGLPGRTSKKDGITVGKARNKIEKRLDQIKGGVKTAGGLGAAYAAYSAADFVNDLLGIKKMGDGTLRAEEKKKIGKAKSETTTTSSKKKANTKTPPQAPPSRPKSIKPKVKPKKNTQQYMTDKSGKATNVKFNSRGGMLKKGKK